MLTRREVLALMGGLPYMRPDQHYEAPTGAIVPGARSVITVKKIVIIAGAGGGLFAYSAAPALGKLVASVTASGGTDPYGNAYLAGVTSYFIGASTIAVQMAAGQITFFTAASAAGPWSSGAKLSVDTTATILNIAAGGGGNVNVLGGIFNALAGASVSGGAAVTGGLTADTETINGSAAAASLLSVTNAVSDSASIVKVTAAAVAAQQIFFGGLLAGDSNARVVLDVNATGQPRVRFGSGAAVPDVLMLRSAANTLQVSGADVDIGTVGRGLQIATGANARMGTAVLVGGTVTVANTTITANTVIFAYCQIPGGTVGFLFSPVGGRVAGTSFKISSSSGTDTSTVGWLLVEPG